MAPNRTIHDVTPATLNEACRVTARAFADDPVLRWVRPRRSESVDARIFRGMVGRKEAEPVVPEAAELAASVAETRDDLAALEARLNRVEGQRRDGPPGRLEAAE